MTHCVFLPGMMCDERVFASQINCLPSDVSYSFEPCVTGGSIEDYAIRAMQGLEEQSDQALIVIGLSMGGIIAMECLRQFPEKVVGVVLIDTNHLADPVERRSVRFHQIQQALSGKLRSVLVEEMKPVYLAPANCHDEQLLSLVLDMALKLGPAVFERQSNALMHRCDYTQTLQKSNKPAAIICGAHDKACPPERHEAMHACMMHSSLHIVENAGHLATLEAPAAVNDVLMKFIVDTQTRCGD